MPFIGDHFWYLVILLVIVLIIWGPGKLGEVGGSLGRGVKEFRKASTETKDQFTTALNATPTTPAPPAAPPVAPPVPPPVAPTAPPAEELKS